MSLKPKIQKFLKSLMVFWGLLPYKTSGGWCHNGAFWDACQCTENEWKSEEGKLEFEVSFVEFHWKFAPDNMTEKLVFFVPFLMGKKG